MTNGYPDEELKALLGEMVRRGKSARPALAASKTPDELKARLKSELSSLGGQFARLRANLASLDPRPRTDLGIRYISPTLPETFVTRAPLAVQPAARAVRELSKPVNLALLPIGGAKMGLAAAGGTIAGAQTGHAIAGERGELIGSIAGGVGAPFAPATGRAVLRGGVRLAEEMGRANVGNVLLPRAPERVAAAAKRPAIPIVTQADITEANRAPAQALIDRLAGTAPGPSGVVPLASGDARLFRIADALGIRTSTDGKPVRFMLAGRPGQMPAASYRSGVVDFDAPGRGRQTYLGLAVDAPAPAPVAAAVNP